MTFVFFVQGAAAPCASIAMRYAATPTAGPSVAGPATPLAKKHPSGVQCFSPG